MKTYWIIAMTALLAGVGTSAQSAELKSSPLLIEKGKAAYAANCVICHGEKGDGNGVAGAAMNPKPRNFMIDKFKLGTAPKLVFKSISEGLKDTAMTGYSHLPEEDRWGLSYYVLSLRTTK
jgi:mono/diheme cytochrome c family protein